MRVTVPIVPFTQRGPSPVPASLRRNITCAPTFSSSTSSAGNARPPKSPLTSALAVSARPGSWRSAFELMRLTASLRVASVIVPSSGAGRAPISLSRSAISLVTRPCRTAFSIALKSASCWRWISVSSTILSSVSRHTFASKNHIER